MSSREAPELLREKGPAEAAAEEEEEAAAAAAAATGTAAAVAPALRQPQLLQSKRS